MIDSLIAMTPTVLLVARPVYALVATPNSWVCRFFPKGFCPR